MFTKSKFLLLACLAVSSNIYASIVREKPTVLVFKPDPKTCEKNESCNLSEFKLSYYNYAAKVEDDLISGLSLGTAAFMSYKTNQVEQLEEFAIVQKIKGCHFKSIKNKDGSMTILNNFKREFFNELIDYKHTDWVIDSIDLDPMYNNNSPDRRHGSYRWNTIQNSTNRDTQKTFYSSQPSRPELYVSDLPGSAFLIDNDHAKNISLQFETCIYKTKDVPLTIAPDDINFATPIACHKWQSSFIFNHDLQKFESKAEIDQACLE